MHRDPSSRLGVWNRIGWMVPAIAFVSVFSIAGCPLLWLGAGNDGATDPNDTNTEPNTPTEPEFANTTDKTNGSARYLGATSCQQCHSDIAAKHSLHGHAFKLNQVNGEPPQFPDGTSAGVPNTPDGFTWADVSYVIGGYTKKGRFINRDGYILTTGVTGKKTQWNLAFPPNGTTAGWANYEATNTKLKPYDHSCFVCHTTGPLPLDEDFPEYQENRPGFAGTWEQPGIQCEACHGPGGNHFTTQNGEVVVNKAGIFVDQTGAATCNTCHNRPYNDQTGKILAAGGWIQHHEQYPELRASGGHKDFTCLKCHDPHQSTMYGDADKAIHTACTDCHKDTTMAGHKGKTYVRTSDGYTEQLTCISCHMPYATKSASNASSTTAGPLGRIGDTKTHIFRIDTTGGSFAQFFSDDATEVRRAADGTAAVTVDFVCLRCHNGNGVFNLSIAQAADIGINLHVFPE